MNLCDHCLIILTMIVIIIATLPLILGCKATILLKFHCREGDD